MKIRIPPPLWMILTGSLMWLVARSPIGFTVSIPYMAEARTIVIVLGALLTSVAIIEFFKLRTTVNPIELDKSTQLATTGIYRISRNPMYLGLAIMLTGWGIHLGSPVNILCIAGFTWLITQWQIKPEEEALRKIFGEEYEAYCRRVRRWI